VPLDRTTKEVLAEYATSRNRFFPDHATAMFFLCLAKITSARYPIDSTVDRFLHASSVTKTARRLSRRIILPVRLEGGALRATMHVIDLSIVRYFGEGQQYDRPFTGKIRAGWGRAWLGIATFKSVL
jgi:hypothetical protein